jgi:acyl-CoA reductase-like NAD-dependent aldehyde dehydrogenase
VPNATADEMQSAVDAAKEAYKSWSKTSILTRQQVMFKYQDIIRKNMVGFEVYQTSFFNFNARRGSWPRV